jgi:tetratricopeptide (TPR) repeat protein
VSRVRTLSRTVGAVKPARLGVRRGVYATARQLLLAALACAVWSSTVCAQTATDGPLQQARELTQRRDFAAALERYRRVLDERPGNVDLLIEVARVQGYADHNAEAAELYRQALALAPQRRADIVPSLAWQLLWRGAAAEAAVLFEELAVQPGPGRADALDGLGQAKQAQGDQAGALAAYRQAHALSPDQLRLHRRLALSLLWNGREIEAIAELERLVARDPGDRDLQWALANARNFAGQHRAALRAFGKLAAPVHPGERADLARAWRWAGYEDRAWPLLADPTDAESAWLRDWRVRRERVAFGYATVERAEDRDDLVARAWVLGGGWHPAPGSTVDLQVRRLDLSDAAGEPRGEQFQASYRWRIGEPDSAWGTLWPTVAARVHHLPGWSPVTPAFRLRWVPDDGWRVDAEAARELVEAPRAVAEHVTVDVLSAAVEHRAASGDGAAGSLAALRFDDGSTRVRAQGRYELRIWGRPRLMAGVEGMAFERVDGGGPVDRGYWNPQRYAEARVYTTLTHEMRPFDIVARLGLGVSREVDADGHASSGRPHLWELGLGWDLSPSLRLGLSVGGSGQGMGLNGGGSGYWRRYLTLTLNTYF